MIRRYWVSALKFEQQAVIMELTPASQETEIPSPEEAAQAAKIDDTPTPTSDMDHVIKEMMVSYGKYAPDFLTAIKAASDHGGGSYRGMAAGPTRLSEARVVFVLSDREYVEAGAPTLLSLVTVTLEFQPTLYLRNPAKL